MCLYIQQLPASQAAKVTCHRRRHLSFHSCTPESARTARFAVGGRAPLERPCLSQGPKLTNHTQLAAKAGSTQPRGATTRPRVVSHGAARCARGRACHVMGHSGARTRGTTRPVRAAKHGRGRRSGMHAGDARVYEASGSRTHGAREEQGRGGATASHGRAVTTYGSGGAVLMLGVWCQHDSFRWLRGAVITRLIPSASLSVARRPEAMDWRR